jgi:hypothetical protein
MQKIAPGLIIALTAFGLAACNDEQPLPLIKADTGEYFVLKYDQKVKGATNMVVGLSMTSTKDDRVIHTFESKPLKLQLDDFDGDGIKDLVYVVYDQNVKGPTSLTVGVSLRVALGKGDGTFGEAQVVKTFASIQ